MSTFHSFEMSATHEHFCRDNFADNGFVTPLFLLSGLRSAPMTIGLRERESCLGNHAFVRFIRSVDCFLYRLEWSALSPGSTRTFLVCQRQICLSRKLSLWLPSICNGSRDDLPPSGVFTVRYPRRYSPEP